MRASMIAGLMVGLAAAANAAAPRAAEPQLEPAAIREDLDQILPILERTHPDLGFTADPAALRVRIAELRAQVTGPMTVRAAWSHLAQLNPLFHDAHVGLRHPVAEYDAYREAGGAVFPVPVVVDREGRLRIGQAVRRDGPVAPMELIESINGIPGERIVADLALRMRGESDSLRRFVLAFNFPAHFWTLYGPQTEYRVVVRDAGGRGRTVLLTDETALPAAARAAELFNLRMTAPDVAIMRIGTFDPALKKEFATFLDGAFDQAAAAGARTLVIDVRDNPGGAHDLSDLVVARLTTRPVSPAARLRARVTAANRDIAPAAAIGDVVHVPFDEPIQPDSRRMAFPGGVYVLVSRDTYSQAIVFATTLQDHGLATVVGEVTGGNANSTGQITLHPLPNTKLQVLAPLYVIYRPNGDERPGGLRPDIAAPHDPAQPQAMIEALLRKIR